MGSYLLPTIVVPTSIPPVVVIVEDDIEPELVIPAQLITPAELKSILSAPPLKNVCLPPLLYLSIPPLIPNPYSLVLHKFIIKFDILLPKFKVPTGILTDEIPPHPISLPIVILLFPPPS